MVRLRRAGFTAAAILIIILTGCSKAGRTESADTENTSDGAAAVDEAEDPEQDSAHEEADPDETEASADLFFEEGNVCTQYLRLTPSGQWEDHVCYHYFQDPEGGRYALDIVERDSMTATDGVGGAVFSIVLYETYPEERGMENPSYLGMLKDEEGNFFYVFLEHFSGTQYTEGSEEAYRAVADSAEDAAQLIEGRNGYTFEAGKDPGKTEDQED